MLAKLSSRESACRAGNYFQFLSRSRAVLKTQVPKCSSPASVIDNRRSDRMLEPVSTDAATSPIFHPSFLRAAFLVQLAHECLANGIAVSEITKSAQFSCENKKKAHRIAHGAIAKITSSCLCATLRAALNVSDTSETSKRWMLQRSLKS